MLDLGGVFQFLKYGATKRAFRDGIKLKKVTTQNVNSILGVEYKWEKRH